MTAEHNHPPRCCCWMERSGPDWRCPACPEHGDLATLYTEEAE
jgi:hypothetical protein